MIGTATGLLMIGCGGAQERAEWEASRVVYSCPTHENIDEAMAVQLGERDLVGVTEALAEIDDQRCWRSALRVASNAPGGDSLRVVTSFISKHGHRIALGKDDGILRSAFDCIASLVPGRGAAGATAIEGNAAGRIQKRYPAARDALRYLTESTLPGVWLKRGKGWAIDAVLKREVARRMAREAVAALAKTGNMAAWTHLEELARDAVDRLSYRFQFRSAQGEKGAFADLINVYALPPGRVAFAVSGTMYLLRGSKRATPAQTAPETKQVDKARSANAIASRTTQTAPKIAVPTPAVAEGECPTPSSDGGETAGVGVDALRARALELLCLANGAYQGERVWAEKIQAGRRNEETVSTADAEADTRLSGFLGQLESQRKLRLLTNEQAAIEAVTRVLFPDFPTGPQEIINGPHREQARHVLYAMKVLREDHADEMALLGLDAFERVVTRSHSHLDRALLADTWGAGFEELLTKRGDLQRALRVFIATALAAFPGDHAADVSRRALVLGPVLEQNAQVDRYLRRGELVVDVDPKTGFELDPPAEGLTLPKEKKAASL